MIKRTRKTKKVLSRKNGITRLTGKQQRFVDEYLIDVNAKEAAIRAGYSVKTAVVLGCQLLQHPKIINALAIRRKQLQKETQWTQRKVLREYNKLIDYDLDDLLDENGKLKPLSEMSKNAKFAVTEFKMMNAKSKKSKSNGENEESEKTLTDFKFTAKKDVLDKIGEHLGMFKTEGDSSSGINVDKAIINVNLID